MGRNLYCIGHYSARLARDVERWWPVGRLVWERAHPVVLSVYSDHQNTGCDARPRMLAAKVACCCGADAEQTGTVRDRARAGARTRGGRAGRTPWRARPALWESPVAPGACGAKAWALAIRVESTRVERIWRAQGRAASAAARVLIYGPHNLLDETAVR